MLNLYNSRQKKKVNAERVVTNHLITNTISTSTINNLTLKSNFAEPLALVSQGNAGEIQINYPYRSQYFQVGPNVTVWGSVRITKEVLNKKFPAFTLTFLNLPDVAFGATSPEYHLPVTVTSVRGIVWQGESYYNFNPENLDLNAVTVRFSTSDDVAETVYDDDLCFQTIYSTVTELP